MKDRYSYSQIQKDTINQFRKIKSTLYPKIEQDNSDVIITSTIGDRLDLLAYRYYGDVTLWWIIAQANSIKNATLNIIPGTRLRISQNLEKIFNDLETINRKR